ncbi:adenylate/guanylate cyclase domain-containing protein [Nitrospinae bacterium AH_259_B05_G02_I21]|nr:adenylate/guanylate cyclase domain-containing protein [Nitrospinae bacterium AH_259_B05_G02_I21]
MADQTHGGHGQDPLEVDRLLTELESLHALLEEHKRPMAILFTDLKGSTAIFGERSDIDGVLVIQRTEALIRPIVGNYGGTVIKTIGDAVMASFPSATEAVEAAIAIQRTLESDNRERTAEDRLVLRIGINAGKGLIKAADVYGQVVNIAAKLQGAAEGDQILISKTMFQALSDELTQRAEPRGTLEVAGLTQPLEVYDVHWQEGDRRPAPEKLAAPSEPHLITMAGENTLTQRLLGGRTIEVSSFPFRVGRNPLQEAGRAEKHPPSKIPTNDLYLYDSPPYRISREHFQIEVHDGKYVVRDRASRLGLIVNGRGIGGDHPESKQTLVKGVNLLVVGDADSPYRFLITA